MSKEENAVANIVMSSDIIDATSQVNDEQYTSVSSPVEVEIGQWYWVKDSRQEWDADEEKYIKREYEWLGCVWHVGSNYVELRQPAKPKEGYAYSRVHFDNFWEELRFEPNPSSVINNNIIHYQGLASKHLSEIKAITARLGISPSNSISTRSRSSNEGGSALVVLSGQEDIKAYESSLILAKEKLLPDLFKAMKDANGELTRWMTAETLPMSAMMKGMEGTIGDITDRIFNVSLYAGLTEDIVLCRDGAPAAFHEKLRVMQRMFYMDEECLLNYRHGGMEFSHIEDFDAWISQDQNRDRILPFPKCLIAMRVRRNFKQREWDGSLLSLYINVRLADTDKYTYLYIRNGDRVSRLSCELNFGETIFPDKSVYDPSVPIMVKMFSERVDQIITRDDYEERLAKENERKELSLQWEKDNPEEEWKLNNPRKCWNWFNPYYRHHHLTFDANEWKPFDQSNVFYDEIATHIAEKIKEHNRIALIIQGLFDRSEVLHPHPPVKIWDPNGFLAAIELIYDAGAVLSDGEMPDFEAYIQRCNESLGPDSIVIGQDDFWQEKEAEKECKRRDNDYRNKSEHRPTKFKPYGNDGPGYLARMSVWKPRSRMATFNWYRERRYDNSWNDKFRGDGILTSITVPADRLFNVSAYRIGDYLQFFNDSRSRAEYLKWAPMLLAAEEYHSGNTKIIGEVQNPVS